MTLRKARVTEIILSVLAGLSAMLSYYDSSGMLIALSLILLLGSWMIDFMYWNCPHCGSHIPRGVTVGDHCPHCGKILDDELTDSRKES